MNQRFGDYNTLLTPGFEIAIDGPVYLLYETKVNMSRVGKNFT